MRIKELGLNFNELEELTTGMVYDLFEEKMIDDAANNEDIQVIKNGSFDDFFPC